MSQQEQTKQAPPGPDRRGSDLSPDSQQFWKSRGYPERPVDWQTRDPKTPPDPSPGNSGKK